jgi:predicted esterase
MVPFEPPSTPDLTGTAVFVGAGRADRIAPPAQSERLAEILRQAGARVTVHWESGGHALADTEVRAAREWIAQLVMGQADGPRVARGESPVR